MPESTHNILQVNKLTIAYLKGQMPAVDSLSFEAQSGEVLGILGGNGAGKTSTLKALAGVMPVSSGEIYLNELELTSPKEADLVRSQIGYCSDIGGLIKQATAREHIDLIQALRPSRDFSNQEVDDLVHLMGLRDKIDSQAGGYSHGIARRLSVLLAYLSADRLMILDEPFDGVDPLGVEATLSLIERAKASGSVVIVSTHLLSLLSECTDRLLIMNLGKVIHESPSKAFTGVAGATHYKELLHSDLQSRNSELE